MKKTGLVLASVLALSACGDSKDVNLDTEVGKASYAIGYKTGEQMNGRMDDLDFEAFIAGMRVGAKGSEADTKLTAEEMDLAITDYQKQKFEQMEAELTAKGEANLTEGAAFREKNGAKDGVTTLESGLQYEVLASGDGGAMPTLADTVVAHYHGTLIDGTVFDSSVDRGEPATFPLNRVIEGWQEALTMMHVGDKWKIVIPSEMAYGPSGVAEVGPNATLVFEVELLGIERGEDSAEG